MSIIYITKDNFDEVVLNGDKPVLLDFYAEWCGPCRVLGPVLEEVAAERSDVVIAKVNIDTETELAKDFKVRSVPTLVLMERGETLYYTIGSKGKAQIKGILDRTGKTEKKKGFLQRLFDK